MNNTCVQCGETRESIKRNNYFCATLYSNENGTEVDQEWERHRFKPYSEKELKARQKDEDEYVKQMGEMAEMFKI